MMFQHEPYDDVGTIDAEDMQRAGPELPTRTYPPDLGPHAFRGVLGDLVRILDPHTEADPAAVLIHALAAFGSVAGRGPHFVADGTAHHANLFAVIVAASSKGRKGTAWSHVRNCFTAIDSDWRIVSGLASGEGLIWHVRDAQYVEREARQKQGASGERETVLEDAGVADKRLFVAEPEFARVLRVCDREGSTLSAVLREAWDTGSLASLTRNSPSRATGAHVSLVGHVTAEELRRYLTATEAGNGFGNRFLWVCARRSKCLPDGGSLDPAALQDVRGDCQHALEHARHVGLLHRDSDAQQLWYDVYPALSDGRPGLLGSMTGRAEAQVMRLACVYALADRSHWITADHLRSALEVWRYCFDSARFVFGESVGNRVADDLLLELRTAGALGLTRTEISTLFGRNRSRTDLGEALALLRDLNLVWCDVDRSGAGRPVERWFVMPSQPSQTN